MERASGSKLLAWRLAKGLTQDQAAKLVGLGQASWHQYERGAMPRDVKVIERLIKLTRGTKHALSLEDFSETDEARARRREERLARTVAKAG
jgi:transcriptional regulator with XRE-family HTH domain